MLQSTTSSLCLGNKMTSNNQIIVIWTVPRYLQYLNVYDLATYNINSIIRHEKQCLKMEGSDVVVHITSLILFEKVVPMKDCK